jgi:hypothetical protein
MTVALRASVPAIAVLQLGTRCPRSEMSSGSCAVQVADSIYSAEDLSEDNGHPARIAPCAMWEIRRWECRYIRVSVSSLLAYRRQSVAGPSAVPWAVPGIFRPAPGLSATLQDPVTMNHPPGPFPKSYRQDFRKMQSPDNLTLISVRDRSALCSTQWTGDSLRRDIHPLPQAPEASQTTTYMMPSQGDLKCC